MSWHSCNQKLPKKKWRCLLFGELLKHALVLHRYISDTGCAVDGFYTGVGACKCCLSNFQASRRPQFHGRTNLCAMQGRFNHLEPPNHLHPNRRNPKLQGFCTSRKALKASGPAQEPSKSWFESMSSRTYPPQNKTHLLESRIGLGKSNLNRGRRGL